MAVCACVFAAQKHGMVVPTTRIPAALLVRGWGVFQNLSEPRSVSLHFLLSCSLFRSLARFRWSRYPQTTSRADGRLGDGWMTIENDGGSAYMREGTLTLPLEHRPPTRTIQRWRRWRSNEENITKIRRRQGRFLDHLHNGENGIRTHDRRPAPHEVCANLRTLNRGIGVWCDNRWKSPCRPFRSDEEEDPYARTHAPTHHDTTRFAK